MILYLLIMGMTSHPVGMCLEMEILYLPTISSFFVFSFHLKQRHRENNYVRGFF